MLSRIGLGAVLVLLSACQKTAPTAPVTSTGPSEEISNWCREVKSEITQLGWKIDPCVGPSGTLDWKSEGRSSEGRPLVYAEFGNPASTNVSIILNMVHPDEVTPLYLGIQLAHWLKSHAEHLADSRVIIVPLASPDGLYKRPRTRTNGRGVDINRNLPTRDWSAKALVAWKTDFKSNPRRFPGHEAGSEPETKFQQALIERFKPQKILSLHAPLGFMDYDGPTALSLSRFKREYVQECLKLSESLKARHWGYFPGSLGNYAGQERGVPTLTLELPTANPKLAEKYWNQFSAGIQTMIQFKMPAVAAPDS